MEYNLALIKNMKRLEYKKRKHEEAENVLLLENKNLILGKEGLEDKVLRYQDELTLAKNEIGALKNMDLYQK